MASAINFGGDVLGFITYVSQKTGLRQDVIAAWVVAENSDPAHPSTKNNPLNIRNGPGGSFRPYPNMKAAADATVTSLHNGRYAPVLGAAKTNDPKAELAAIANSPWDAGHYGGKGQNLLGAYVRVTHQPAGSYLPPEVKTIINAPETAADAAQKAADALNPVKWVKDFTGWADAAALRALAYLVLTIAAIALFVLGLEKTLGPTPLTRTMPINPRTAPIPF
ncbi:MAG TPA: hypothetical protein VIM33_04915 [Gaiellaceae bacterium]|jgi:hypothetical protein